MRKLAILLAVLSYGCSDPFGLGPDVLYTGREPFTPPAAYEAMYADVAACWGVAGDFSRIRWFVSSQIDIVGEWEDAAAAIKGDEITIKWGRRDVPLTVMHEMSHHASGRGNEIHYDEGRRALCDDAGNWSRTDLPSDP